MHITWIMGIPLSQDVALQSFNYPWLVNCGLKNIICVFLRWWWKGQRQKQSKSSILWFSSKRPQRLGWLRLKPRGTWNFHLCLPHELGPSAAAILGTIRGEETGSRKARIWTSHPIWDASISGCSLTCCAIIQAPNICLEGWKGPWGRKTEHLIILWESIP